GATRGEVSRGGVSTDHLRPRVRSPREPRAAALARAGRQAVAGLARVRARPRRAGALHPPRAAAARARMRVRRARAGERAGGPAAVTSRSLIVEAADGLALLKLGH